jgi:phosphatidylglycerophosphate synthase
MLDNTVRRWIDPMINRAGQQLAAVGVHANAVTLFGFASGSAAGLAIVFEYYTIGLVLLLISRLADGLDGAVARASNKTDLGGFLDITLDFVFYGMIPLAFIIADPAANAVAGSVLIFAFYATGASFLAFALMAEKRGATEEQRGSKSLVYTTGLAEATETIAVFVAFCLFPTWFSVIAFGFAALCLITVVSRIWLAAQTFTD